MKVAFIGFSEAGPAFAEAMIRNGATVRAFDILSLDPETAPAQRARAARVGAQHSGSVAAAVDGAEIVISTVTATAALIVAEQSARFLEDDQFFCDLNSVSPRTKLAIRDKIAPSGARFVEAVAMGRTAEGRLPPLLLSGPDAPELHERLSTLGLSVSVAGTEWGAAPAAKLLRSVVVKGFEAVLSEAFEAAVAVDAVEPLMATLSDWLPGVDWPDVVPYHLGRISRHGTRRAAELRECVLFLNDLGIDAATSKAAATTQERKAAIRPVL